MPATFCGAPRIESRQSGKGVPSRGTAIAHASDCRRSRMGGSIRQNWRIVPASPYNGGTTRRAGRPPGRPRPEPDGRLEPTPMPTPNELYDQAVDLKDRGDREEAIARLEEAIAIDPKFAIAHGMLAKLYVALAQGEKAVEHAKKVVEIEPDDVFSYTALSVIYQRSGKIPEAEHAKAIAFNKQMGLD